MPTYEYACRACGEHLEVVQSFKDDPLTECPGCGGDLRKVFSAAGLIFKGSGWHIKDYGTSKASTRAESKGDGGGDSADGSASKDSASSSTSESSKSSSSSSEGSKAKPAEKTA